MPQQPQTDPWAIQSEAPATATPDPWAVAAEKPAPNKFTLPPMSESPYALDRAMARVPGMAREAAAGFASSFTGAPEGTPAANASTPAEPSALGELGAMAKGIFSPAYHAAKVLLNPNDVNAEQEFYHVAVEPHIQRAKEAISQMRQPGVWPKVRGAAGAIDTGIAAATGGIAPFAPAQAIEKPIEEIAGVNPPETVGGRPEQVAHGVGSLTGIAGQVLLGAKAGGERDVPALESDIQGKMMQAMKPGAKTAVQAQSSIQHPNVVGRLAEGVQEARASQDPNIHLDVENTGDMAEVARREKTKLWSNEVQPAFDAASSQRALLDPDKVSSAANNAITKDWEIDHPGEAQKARETLNQHLTSEPLTVQRAEDLLQHLNGQNEVFYALNPGAKRAAMNIGTIAARVKAASALREGINGSFEKIGVDPDIKKQYGALTTVQEHLERQTAQQLASEIRKNPGLLSTYGIEQLVEGALFHNPERMARGGMFAALDALRQRMKSPDVAAKSAADLLEKHPGAQRQTIPQLPPPLSAPLGPTTQLSPAPSRFDFGGPGPEPSMFSPLQGTSLRTPKPNYFARSPMPKGGRRR